MLIDTLLTEVDKCREKAQVLREDKDYFKASQHETMALKIEDVVAFLVTGQVELY